MELYYKDLISEETSLEKLVDDLMLVVQGADALAEAAGAALPEAPKQEITTRLQRLKESCRRAKEQAKRSALAAGKVVRQYPYSSAGFAFAAGLLLGVMLAHSRSSDPE
jgi:ElaB/YqjD/DUF883 family membrane-anchored ribosome-binding protein